MTLIPAHRTDTRPTVALLAPGWGAVTEEAWLTRQVAGALACIADVHVITPDGRRAPTSADGVFTLHHLPVPVEAAAELHRDVLLAELSVIDDLHQFESDVELAAMLDDRLIRPWAEAPDVLQAVDPDLVVIAGHRSNGALTALEAFHPSVPMVLIALGTELGILGLPYFEPIFARAQSVVAVTQSEHEAIEELVRTQATVHTVGAPMAINPGAHREPDLVVGETEYVLVLTEARSKEACGQSELAHLLRVSLPDTRVAIAQEDEFCVWHRGRGKRTDPVLRSSDRTRLMAWARTTVDLRPGPLFARRCVESLLYGTPIVVPTESRAREHAERGRGGLWFSNANELTECVRLILEPDVRAGLGTQGQAYAEATFGSTDTFIERVAVACGLDPRSSAATT